MRTATLSGMTLPPMYSLFQSSRSLRTATPAVTSALGTVLISILAVLADRDPFKVTERKEDVYFNPRGPCGPRQGEVELVAGVVLFQSSRSLRTATGPVRAGGGCQVYFNPRGPCGPRQTTTSTPCATAHFNPRGPCGPRPLIQRLCFPTFRISILAVLADRDIAMRPSLIGSLNFNPRGPCGPRRSQARGLREP